MKLKLLGGLTPAQFMRRHWQKRPLFVRGALRGLDEMLSVRALADFARREDVESRLVERRRGRWSVRHGPISRRQLKRAGARDWTILVSGLNLHCPQADALLRRFAFVPHARLDDVMASYAPPGGGVGPHVDSYDVFLVQGRGHRRWRLARPGRYCMAEGSPLRHVRRFKAEAEHVAQPGDLLYLPPGWAHDGVALDACVTYSVGFRAPRGEELGAAFLDWLHERGLPRADYRDPRLAATRHPGRIPAQMVDFAARALGALRWSRADVREFLGRHLSAPKPSVFFAPVAAARRRLATCQVRLDSKAQLLYLGSRFYMNGETLRVRPGDAAPLRELADERTIAGKKVARRALQAQILQWQKSGFVHLDALQ